MSEMDPERTPTEKARARLANAERCVEIQRAILSNLPVATKAFDLALALLQQLERSVFCRRLEFDAVLKSARRASPTQSLDADPTPGLDPRSNRKPQEKILPAISHLSTPVSPTGADGYRRNHH